MCEAGRAAREPRSAFSPVAPGVSAGLSVQEDVFSPVPALPGAGLGPQDCSVCSACWGLAELMSLRGGFLPATPASRPSPTAYQALSTTLFSLLSTRSPTPLLDTLPGLSCTSSHPHLVPLHPQLLSSSFSSYGLQQGVHLAPRGHLPCHALASFEASPRRSPADTVPGPLSPSCLALPGPQPHTHKILPSFLASGVERWGLRFLKVKSP